MGNIAKSGLGLIMFFFIKKQCILYTVATKYDNDTNEGRTAETLSFVNKLSSVIITDAIKMQFHVFCSSSHFQVVGTGCEYIN